MAGGARAMVFEGPGRPFREVMLDPPVLREGEALVRIALATICGSDLHTYEGRRDTPCPTILGHKMIGSIEALPAAGQTRDHKGQPLRRGDRVTWSIAASCGDCFYCTHGLPQKCKHLFKYGHEPIRASHALSGGLATHCHLARGTTVVRLPDDLPNLVACPASCATATIAAAVRLAGELEGAAVLVLGAGMLGLTATATAMAKSAGAATVIVCDPDRKRLAAAERFGSSLAVPAGDDPSVLRAAVDAATDGRGIDLALELSGSPEAIEAGLPLLRVGGRFVWVGSVFPTRAVEILPEQVVRRHLTIQGVHNYQPRDLVAAVEFLAARHGEYPFVGLVARTFPLAQADEAFRYAIEHRPFRVALQPGP